MKYGILLNKRTDNIGDDIQSFAEVRFLPSIDYVIDRESLDTFGYGKIHEPVTAIMNSWYMYNKYNWPPSPVINPLFLAVHISEKDYFGIGTRFLDSIGGDYLKHYLKYYGPIGARDKSTMDLLNSKGINSYFSGCLTLTLNLETDDRKTDEILLVDVEDADCKVIKDIYPNLKWIELTHTVNPNEYKNLTLDSRFNAVKSLLDRYKNAKCVITSRMHCALPCLALGTPVLLIYKQENMDRFQSFLPMLHNLESGSLEQIRGYFDVIDPPQNPDDYLIVRKDLEERCKKFITDAEAGIVMPKYDVTIEEIHIWQKELLQEADLSMRNSITELVNWIEELEQGKEWNVKQLEKYETANFLLGVGRDGLITRFGGRSKN